MFNNSSGNVAIVLAVIAAISGWGTSLLTNWGSIFGGSELASVSEDNGLKKSSACKNIEGRWHRPDNLILELSQTGCRITGRVVSDSNSDSHEVLAMLSGDEGVGYTRRSVAGCTTYLATEYSLLSDNQLQIDEKGGGCKLENYKNGFVYSRIP